MVCGSIKSHVRRSSFAGFCELAQEVQFKVKTLKLVLCFSRDSDSLKFENKSFRQYSTLGFFEPILDSC
jgi:hypothetical protein